MADSLAGSGKICHLIYYSFLSSMNTYHSQQKIDRATERTTHTATTSPPAVQTDFILPPDHPRMEQPTPGNSGSQVPGLFQVQACCPPVTRQTTPSPSPSIPLCFLCLLCTPPLLFHTPFPHISKVSTATSTNQHNHHSIDVG